MRRPQLTLRALLVAMLVVGAFFGGLIIGLQWGLRDAEKIADGKAARRQEAEYRWMKKNMPEFFEE